MAPDLEHHLGKKKKTPRLKGGKKDLQRKPRNEWKYPVAARDVDKCASG